MVKLKVWLTYTNFLIYKCPLHLFTKWIEPFQKRSSLSIILLLATHNEKLIRGWIYHFHTSHDQNSKNAIFCNANRNTTRICHICKQEWKDFSLKCSLDKLKSVSRLSDKINLLILLWFKIVSFSVLSTSLFQPSRLSVHLAHSLCPTSSVFHTIVFLHS